MNTKAVHSEPEIHGPDTARARAAFPRGLTQPEGGFRFSLDSLLVACFVRCKPGQRIVDVGTGCGVIGLGICLRHLEQEPVVTGLDADPAMVRAAQENARKLGLEGMFSAGVLDVRRYRDCPELRAGSFDQAVCNPPYRRPGQGRFPRQEAKGRACFEHSAELEDFLRTAAYGIKNRGRVSLVYLAERLPELLHGLSGQGLEPKELRMVHPSQSAAAGLVLVAALKGARPGLQVHPPLILANSAELSAFCPLLPRSAKGG